MPTYYVGTDLHTRTRRPARRRLLEGGMGLRYIRDSVAGCRISKIALLAALVAGRSSAPRNRSQE